jgi:hypothetical protein
MADGTPGPGPEGQALNNTNPIDNSKPTQEQDLERINGILSRPGVKETLQRFGEQFELQPGKETFYGVRPDGLVVAARRIGSPSVPTFNVWAIDASLQPDQIEASTISTTLKPWDVEVFRNGMLYYPGHTFKQNLEELTQLSEDQIKEKYPDDANRLIGNVAFYKRTGGFGRESAMEAPDGIARISVGKLPLYPLSKEK